MSSMDYHDLKMLKLEQAAEEHLKNASEAVDRGELAAQREVPRWTITLDKIRQMRSAILGGSRAGHSPVKGGCVAHSRSETASGVPVLFENQ